jgi:ribosome-associated protein
MTARELARRAAEAALDKLGEDIVVLEMGQKSPLADCFVLCTAASAVHAQAIAEEVLRALKEEGQRPHHVEGLAGSSWVLLDYLDVVVHIFLGDVRTFYGLERLWGDVPRQTFPSS